MTVTVQDPIVSYVGNGVTAGPFTFPFRIITSDDLKVSLDGTLTTAYLISGIGEDQGSVSFNVAPGAGVKILMFREVALERDTDYQFNGDLLASTVNADFDRIWMALQDIDDTAGRAIHYPIDEFGVDGTLPGPTQRAGKILAFDANGAQTYLPMPTAVGAGDLRDEIGSDGKIGFVAGTDFTAGVTTQLALSREPVSKANISVQFDAAYQGGDQILSIVGNILLFTSPIPAGTQRVYVRTGTTVSLNTPAFESVTDESIAPGSKVYNRINQFFDVKDFHAKCDGTTDDQAAVVSAATAAGSTGTVLISGPCKISDNVTFSGNVVFAPGATLVTASGKTVTFANKPDALPDQKIFFGLGTIANSGALWSQVSLDWFVTSTDDVGPAIAQAWALTNNIVALKKNYKATTPAIVPQARAGLTIKGAGYRSTIFTCANNISVIQYQRTSPATLGTNVTISGIEFQELGFSKTSVAILYFGAFTGTYGSETTFADDNWLRVYECHFLGFQRCTWTRFVGFAHFERNYSAICETMHYKERDSSFHYHIGEISPGNSFLNGTYIYQDDPTNDALSNGCFITDCHSVNGTGIDIRFKNYQTIFIKGSSFDLGSSGPAACWFLNCQDVHIENGWVASSSAAGTAGRVGIYMETSRNSSASGLTFVNNQVGFEGNNSKSISITNNAFDSQKVADIVDIGTTPIGYVVTGNRHTTLSSQNAIQLGGASSSSHVVTGNIHKQVSYSILAGTNSITTGNIFSAPL